MHVCFWYNAEARTKDLTLLTQCHCHLSYHCSKFSVYNLCVCKYISYFQFLMYVQSLWKVDVYQQNMFRRGRNGTDNHILNQDLFSFVSMQTQKKSNISVSRLDFDSQYKPNVFSSWTEFDLCFAIEKSRSFQTVICSTNSSSHCLSRDAEHVRLIAFRWRCDEVKCGGFVWKVKNRYRQKL